MTSPLEDKLSLRGKQALKEIRALHRLPANSGTLAAENSVLRGTGTPDVRLIALILAEEETNNGR